jgi:hypothetical protein
MTTQEAKRLQLVTALTESLTVQATRGLVLKNESDFLQHLQNVLDTHARAIRPGSSDARQIGFVRTLRQG